MLSAKAGSEATREGPALPSGTSIAVSSEGVAGLTIEKADEALRNESRRSGAGANRIARARADYGVTANVLDAIERAVGDLDQMICLDVDTGE